MNIELRTTSDFLQTWVVENNSDDVDEASVSVANLDSPEHIELYPKNFRFKRYRPGKRDLKIGKYWTAPIRAEQITKASAEKITSDEIAE